MVPGRHTTHMRIEMCVCVHKVGQVQELLAAGWRCWPHRVGSTRIEVRLNYIHMYITQNKNIDITILSLPMQITICKSHDSHGKHRHSAEQKEKKECDKSMKLKVVRNLRLKRRRS